MKSSTSSMVSRRTPPARERPLQPLGDRLQGRLLLGGLTEGADQHGHDGDRSHALAPYVAHEEPYAVRGVLHGVQVAPDERALLSRLVPCRDLEAADPRRRFGQYGPLGGLRDLAGGGEARVAAAHEPVDADGEHGGRGHGEDLGGRARVEGEPEVDEGHARGRQDSRPHRGAEREEGCGDECCGREEGSRGEVLRGEEVVADTGDDQQRRQRADEGALVRGGPLRGLDAHRLLLLHLSRLPGADVAGERTRTGRVKAPGDIRRKYPGKHLRPESLIGFRPRAFSSGDRI
ncbi:hypothetical protein QFZ24_004789 [Streptomyces phaeochromogenes]|nr:hypothetical protein [Streptomyces phaeochromogenes]